MPPHAGARLSRVESLGMIRRSLFVACVAIFISLLVHGLGLGWKVAMQAPAPERTEDGAPTVPDVGGDFEDLVERVEEPAAPEPSEPPTTPEVTPPDQVPTTQALVASDNPQDVIAPDAASEAAEEPGAEIGQEADEIARETGEDETVSDIEIIAPETPDVTPQAPVGVEDAVPEVSQEAEVVEAEEEVEPEVTPSETETAALAPAPQAPDSVISAEEPDLETAAVARSLRPPSRRPTPEELGVPEQRPVQRAARTPRYESPITAYKRNGTDLLALGRIGSSRGGVSFSGSGGSGNAGTTNYAGRVLVKLNRGPLLNRAEKGMARVYFQINGDGSVGWVRVLNTSGSSGIGRAAQAQVRSAAPFPRPPGGKPEQLVFVYRHR